MNKQNTDNNDKKKKQDFGKGRKGPKVEEERKEYNLLFVDDEQIILDTISSFFRREKEFSLTLCRSAEEGLGILENREMDLVISDIKMTGMSGIQFLEKVRERHPDLPFIILSGLQDVPQVVEAIKKGAQDFLSKPVARELLLHSVRKVLQEARFRSEIRRLQHQVDERYLFQDMVGSSRAIRNVFEKIKVISDTDATVLVQGETGTGKELVARAIHRQSFRSGSPFIKINCAAISDTLLESELFGHEKGAFTGAVKTKQGRFELSKGGTILLDEIGDVSPAMQSKLLRVLQEKEFERVGGIRTIKVDVRIIAATNADLQDYIRHDRFRQDLYYRLNVFPIVIPPLRDRREDIPLLAEHFLKQYAKRFNRQVQFISQELISELMSRPWPGNVRELENLIERGVIVCQGDTLRPEDLGGLSGAEGRQAAENPGCMPDPLSGGGSYQEARALLMEQLERKYLETSLLSTGGSISGTSRLMGLSPRCIYEKMRKYGLDKSKFKTYGH